MLRRPLPTLCASLVLALTPSAARAQIVHLESFMNGANEVPPVPTATTGIANYFLDTAALNLKFRVTHTGFTSMQTAAHIHRTSTTAVIFPLPVGMAVSGSFAVTAPQSAELQTAAATYTNLHTMAFSGGEIRGPNNPAPALGTPMCFGDGSSGPCPCGNAGAAGRGCDNSISTGGALLQMSGHTSPDNVTLITTGERPTAITIVIQGNLMIAPVNFGDGLRCVGGTLKRLVTKNAVNGTVIYPETAAEPTVSVRAAALGQPNNPGDTRWYFMYYRDGTATFCAPPVGDSFNSSNAVQVTW